MKFIKSKSSVTLFSIIFFIQIAMSIHISENIITNKHLGNHKRKEIIQVFSQKWI